jgi:hypothetical protein
MSPVTGVGTTGTAFNGFGGVGSGGFQDIAFRPSDGKLSGESQGTLYTFNLTTGIGDCGGTVGHDHRE